MPLRPSTERQQLIARWRVVGAFAQDSVPRPCEGTLSLSPSNPPPQSFSISAGEGRGAPESLGHVQSRTGAARESWASGGVWGSADGRLTNSLCPTPTAVEGLLALAFAFALATHDQPPIGKRKIVGYRYHACGLGAESSADGTDRYREPRIAGMHPGGSIGGGFVAICQ